MSTPKEALCAACGQPGHRYGRNEGIDRFNPQACINGLLARLEDAEEAARRVADAPEIEWCEEHQAPEDPSEPPWCLRARLAFDAYQDDSLADNCRMVRRLLVDPGNDDE